MQRPPGFAASLIPALTLTIFGAVGVTLLALLAGLVACTVRGSGIYAAALRMTVVGAAFILWLYLWRRLTLWFRSRACS